MPCCGVSRSTAATSHTGTPVAGDTCTSGHFRSQHRCAGLAASAETGNRSKSAADDPDRKRHRLCFLAPGRAVLGDDETARAAWITAVIIFSVAVTIP